MARYLLGVLHNLKEDQMKTASLLVMLAAAIFLSSCGGGGGGGNGVVATTGSLSVALTDAKPVLPERVEKVRVTINEVSVHQSGGGWTSVTLTQNPFTVDLLQFAEGRTTQLVPPVSIASGHYTQVRLGVSSAVVVINGVDHPMEIPSDSLKTDKNFDFDVPNGGAVALTVDFDLSQSIVVQGSGTYRLKPILHLVSTTEAAKITGSIARETFGSENSAMVIVTVDSDSSGDLATTDEEYTRVTVDKDSSGPSQFSIFWLVPNQSYIVQVVVDGDVIYTEFVGSSSLPTGAIYPLHSGNPIQPS
jgi:hypothetical protein